LSEGFLLAVLLNAGGILQWTLSHLAQSPLPGGNDFLTVVPDGDVTSFLDRWLWVTKKPTPPAITPVGIWTQWIGMSASSRAADAVVPLRTSAASFSYFDMASPDTYPILW
jgi:hypothetical protein